MKRERDGEEEEEQGCIHGSNSRGRVGRSGKPRKIPCYRRTDGLTDQKVTYRVACPRLKREKKKSVAFDSTKSLKLISKIILYRVQIVIQL